MPRAPSDERYSSDLEPERTFRGETFGQRLRRLRLERDMSQREIASKCHRVSYAYISRIEAGARQPTTRAIRELAAALDVGASYLEFGRELDPALHAAQRKIADLEKQLEREQRRNARLVDALGRS